MAFPTALDASWVDASTFSASKLRGGDAPLFAGTGAALGVRGGVARHGDTSLAVTVDASDVITVQAGPVVVAGTDGMPYRLTVTTATTESLTARNATNPRYEVVVATIDATTKLGSITRLVGPPAAVPALPEFPSMYVELARITVPATGGGAASVDSTFRTYAAAAGAEIVVPTSARLPASAATGQRAVALDSRAAYQWSGTTWAPLGVQLFARKTADELVVSSTALQNDDHLFVTIPAAGTYLIDVGLIARSAADNAGDISVGFAFPAGTLDFSGQGPHNSLATGSAGTGEWVTMSASASPSNPIPYGLSNTAFYGIGIKLSGILVASAAGSLQLRWAQLASNANATTVKANSYMRVTGVA